MADESNFLPWFVELRDRFGDNGLISVVILRIESEELLVDSWVMSCRVLGRGVEQFVMNEVFRVAGELGMRRVRGVYRPTAKNGMVRGFFEGFGFLQESVDGDGETVWCLDVGSYLPRPVFMSEAA